MGRTSSRRRCARRRRRPGARWFLTQRRRGRSTSIPSRGTEPAHLHLDVRFLVLTDRPEALREDPAESAGVRWFDLEEALHRAGTDEMRRLLTKARAVLGV